MRIISRLDIKNSNLIKGLSFEGLRQLGDAEDFAKQYFEENIDEIMYIDSVASLYSREGLYEILTFTVKNIFVPVTVSGAIKNVEDALEYFKYGADKVSVNTAAVERPELIDELVKSFGSANVSLSIEAKKTDKNSWNVFTSTGRDDSKKDLKNWISEAVDRGVGEISVTSIDNDGYLNGFDYEMIECALESCSVPLIVGGGFGKLEHLDKLDKSLSGILIGSALHYKKLDINSIKTYLGNLDFEIRN